jgi:hypothetical protein
MGKSDISHKEMIFRDAIGQKATVEREQATVEEATRPNQLLHDLGATLQGMRPHMQNYRYMGSAAVHIFYNEVLEQVDFISQTAPLDMQGCPEILAAKAFDDLLGTMKEMYGHKRSKLRSGF